MIMVATLHPWLNDRIQQPELVNFLAVTTLPPTKECGVIFSRVKETLGHLLDTKTKLLNYINGVNFLVWTSIYYTIKVNTSVNRKRMDQSLFEEVYRCVVDTSMLRPFVLPDLPPVEKKPKIKKNKVAVVCEAVKPPSSLPENHFC